MVCNKSLRTSLLKLFFIEKIRKKFKKSSKKFNLGGQKSWAFEKKAKNLKKKEEEKKLKKNIHCPIY